MNLSPIRAEMALVNDQLVALVADGERCLFRMRLMAVLLLIEFFLLAVSLL